ncbi:hypothetical protein PILCRDRAFT_821004 [Piloderma croceum F 1598]|uniref:DUF2415 domain-containing protein n=1 Tax=Piloderma croceum (strain F 1598) TaxID=765440 RepID=A0A0C3FR07_PILCF|nr:hypothetical protein PILCRDRAFT_821004 [Piloderma croceum F 1598]
MLLSTFLPASSKCSENFVRLAKWCPDGSTALAQSENQTFHFLDLPPELQSISLSHISPITKTINSSFTRSFRQSSPILDFAWYPQATVQNPASFCFVASVRDTPVRLLDAGDGRLRASYKIVDHRERQVAPHSLAFNLTADKLYCGFESAIEIFDVNRPGDGTRLLTSPNKKSRDGMKGIISSLAFSPSTPTSFYAAGTLVPTISSIALYDASVDEVVMYLGLGNSERRKAGGGVTQLCFNPLKPHMLYASFRRCGSIYAWDLRGGSTDGQPLYKYHFAELDSGGRKMTNQRLRFDVDIGGRWLGIGNQNGDVSLFDLDHESVVEAETENDLGYGDSVQEIAPTFTFKAHEDAIGSVSFHPLHPLLLSVSGSRHFTVPSSKSRPSNSEFSSDSNSESEDADASDDCSVDEGFSREKSMDGVRRIPHGVRPYTLDSCIRMWGFGDSDGSDRDTCGS